MSVKRILFTLFVIVLVLIGLFAGYVIVSYQQMAGGSQRDLGVRYSMADYERAVADKAGVTVNDPSSLYLGARFTTTGAQRIDRTFSDAEISAIQNYSNEQRGPFKNAQIKFSEGGVIDASGVVTDPRIRIPGPVYVRGSVTPTGPRQFDIRVDSIVVGDFVVPTQIVSYARKEFSSYVNGILAHIDGLAVESVDIRSGQVRFKGSIPQTVTGEK